MYTVLHFKNLVLRIVKNVLGFFFTIIYYRALNNTFTEKIKMRLIIKILQGDECIIEVEREATVLEVKKKIHAQCETPVSKQRLLFLGKTLIDEKQLAEYPTIKDDSKIYLVVKTPDSLIVALQKFFKLHFPQSVADKHSASVHADLLKQIDNMSLDDIERLAKFYIDKDMLENGSN